MGEIEVDIDNELNARCPLCEGTGTIDMKVGSIQYKAVCRLCDGEGHLQVHVQDTIIEEIYPPGY